MIQSDDFSEPGLLEELQKRVEAAEQKFKAAELDDHLSEFEVAKQRQVMKNYFFSWKRNPKPFEFWRRY